MKDAAWAAAHRSLLARLITSDAVLLPRGEWDPLPCPVRLYDAVIELGDATVLVLHKGRLTGLSKSELAGVVSDWRCIFANNVLVVYARALPRALADRVGLYYWHKRRVHDHLRARALRRLPATIFYIHMPKTGGTAVLSALRRIFRSAVYFTTVEAFLAHPPEPGEFDLVAVHGHASLLVPLLAPGDLLAGLVRDPARRVLSGVTHSRRQGEDPATFTPAQRAMREDDLAAFLSTETGRFEARLQLILLGSSHDRPEDAADDGAMLIRASALVEGSQALFATASQSQDFLRALLSRFGLRAPRLRRRNVNAPAAYGSYAAEFERARAMLEPLQSVERTLVEGIRRRFNASQPGGCSLLRKPAKAISPSGQGP